MIDRYFFSFGFDSRSVVLPMEFSSSVRGVQSGTHDATTHGAPSSSSS